ncbi:MAG: right-handed parallel beta-helix repeat-containing protein [Candidatus Bathyarchaeota archaeon]|nr:right-handed parallel beta-helix repeat-containing protein [Candidatus Bathyarchaeota archaeon]
MKRRTLALILIIVLSFSMPIVAFADAAAEEETVYIRADGSIEGTTSILRNGNVYTLTGNISGGIQVQKSHIVIDGAGYAVKGKGEYGRGIDLSNGVGQDPSRSSISNVTLKNLKIINCYYAISSENTHNNTFVGNYISDCDTGFWITGSSNNTLMHNTVKNCVTGISINYGSGGNIIVENNILSSFSVWLSPEPLVDKNYWGDYLTRYPSAKEVGSTGIWDTPYDRETFKDNHPLTKPVAISYDNAQLPDTDNGTEPTSELFLAALAVVSAVSVALIAMALLVYFKKRKK